MIDTHCHLLPALDDGPPTEADSVQLARALAEEGVTRVLCTPHYSSAFPVSVARARERLQRARNVLDALGIPLELELAAEVSVERALRAPLTELTSRAIRGRFLLVELVSLVPRSAPEAVHDRLADEGLQPVFAHPERWLARVGRVDLLDGLHSLGARLQVVGASLVGSADASVWETAWELVASGRADLIGSDAHRAGGRRVQLRALADLLDERCGTERRQQLLERAPARLLDGDPAREARAVARASGGL